MVGHVLASLVISGVPVAGLAAGIAVVLGPAPAGAGLGGLLLHALLWLAPATVVGFSVTAVLVCGLVRLLSLWIREGHSPVRSGTTASNWPTWVLRRTGATRSFRRAGGASSSDRCPAMSARRAWS